LANDYLVLLNTAAYGFTNGFLTTSCFILGPRKVTHSEKEAVAYLNVIGLLSGIFIGA